MIIPLTSESVTEGHPDKICDRISDTILDAILQEDPAARVAVETLATRGLIHVVGEVTTSAYVEIPKLVREVILGIGYNSSRTGFDGATCGVSVSIGQQSPDIAEGVDRSQEARTRGEAVDRRAAQGAGDQGMMFGYATDETPTLMPAPIWLAHSLARRLAQVRKEELVPGLFPDGKAQVTLGYENGRPVSVDTVVVSSQHDDSWQQEELAAALTRAVIEPVLAETELDQSELRVLVNPSGRFVLGGPAADAGLTGRKIIVDTYGGAVPHGGGAFSGKDPSKVDRSGAYAARWVAKNVVAAGLARRCQVQLAYAIGSSEPVAIVVQTFGTGIVSDEVIARAVREVFDLRPLGIIEDLGLVGVRYADLAAYGHLGRDGYPWEETNRVQELRAAIG
ncbi:methionine adenosyltransferase [Actinomyces sp. F1_1611]